MRPTLEFSFTNRYGACVMVQGQTPDLEPLTSDSNLSSGTIAYIDFRGNPEGEFVWADETKKIVKYGLPSQEEIVAKLKSVRNP